jgi:ketosteroid isomerase-like protein
LFLAALLWANAITSAEPVRKTPDNPESLSKIVESLKSAWNKNDADRIAELFLPDAILVLPTGSVAQSRSEIRQRVSPNGAVLKDTQLSYAVEDVSLLNNDTAVVTGKYRLNGVKILGLTKRPKDFCLSPQEAARPLDDLQSGDFPP